MIINKNKAFTLTEVMITLVIISVLAGLAVPAYFRTIEQSRSNEALVNLNIIHLGEKIYRLNNGTFWGPGTTSIGVVNTALTTDMSAVYYTGVAVTGNAVNYMATLTRNTVQGGAGSKFFRYTYTNGAAAPVFTEGGSF